MSESKYVKGLDADFDKSVEGAIRHIQQADYNAGATDERKRIIELLEKWQEKKLATMSSNNLEPDFMWFSGFDKAIRLIKNCNCQNCKCKNG